jgi:hypothetical protein
MTTEQLFLVALFSGIIALVCGMLLIRANWRGDVVPFGRHSRTLDILLHPEKYARPELLRVIRTLNWMGLAFLLIAVGLLIHEAIGLHKR